MHISKVSERHFNCLKKLALHFNKQNKTKVAEALNKSEKHFRTVQQIIVEKNPDIYNQSFVTTKTQREALELINSICEDYLQNNKTDNLTKNLFLNIHKISKEFKEPNYV